MSAEECDASMTQRDQVLRGQHGTALVFHRQEVPFPIQFAVEYQHGYVASDGLCDRRTVAAFRGRQDDAGRCVFDQRGKHRLLPLGGFTGAAKQGHATGFGQGFVDARCEFGEEGIGQVVDHQRDAGRRT